MPHQKQFYSERILKTNLCILLQHGELFWLYVYGESDLIVLLVHANQMEGDCEWSLLKRSRIQKYLHDLLQFELYKTRKPTS